MVGHDRVCVNAYWTGEIHIGVFIGRSESEIFCLSSAKIHYGSEIFRSECKKNIVAKLICTHCDILVLGTISWIFHSQMTIITSSYVYEQGIKAMINACRSRFSLES